MRHQVNGWGADIEADPTLAMSTHAEHHAERARHLIEAGRPEAAVSVLGQAIASEPGWEVPHGLLAWAHLETGQPRKALDAAGRAVVLAPDDEWGHRLYGTALAELGRNEDALVSFKEAVRLDPELPQAQLSLAQHLLRMNRTDEAAAAAEHLGSLAPEYAPAHEVLGQIRLARKDYERAAAALRTALELEPENERCLALFSRALSHLQKTGQAHQYLEFAARMNPLSGTVRREAERVGQEDEDTQANLLVLCAVFTLAGSFIAWTAIRAFLNDSMGRAGFLGFMSVTCLAFGALLWKGRPDRPPETLLRFFKEVRRQRLAAAWKRGAFRFVLAFLYDPTGD